MLGILMRVLMVAVLSLELRELLMRMGKESPEGKGNDDAKE